MGPRYFPSADSFDVTLAALLGSVLVCRNAPTAIGMSLLALRIEKRSFYPVTRCSPLALRPEGGSQIDIRVRLAAVSCIDWIALRIGRRYAELTSPISVCEVLVNQYQTMHFMSENIEDLAHLSHAC